MLKPGLFFFCFFVFVLIFLVFIFAFEWLFQNEIILSRQLRFTFLKAKLKIKYCTKLKCYVLSMSITGQFNLHFEGKNVSVNFM